MDKEKWIGAIAPKLGGGNHPPNDHAILAREFENPNSVAYFFCSGCNSLYELSEDAVEQLKERTNLELVSEKHYYETNGCRECGGWSDHVEVKEAEMH